MKDSKNSNLTKKSEETKGNQETESNIQSEAKSLVEEEERESEFQESNMESQQQSENPNKDNSQSSDDSDEEDDDDEEESYNSSSNSEENMNIGEEVDTKNLLKHNFGNTDKNFLSEGNSSLKQTQLSKTSRKKTGLVVATRAIYMNTTVNMPVICKLISQSYLRNYSYCDCRWIGCISLPSFQ